MFYTTNSVRCLSNGAIEDWAEACRQCEWNQKMEHQRAIDVLQTVLDGREDPERAAALIASTYNPLLKQGFSLSPVHQLWGMVCSSIRMLGGNVAVAKRLVSLLNAIANLQDVTDHRGNAIGLAKEGFNGVYWKDLPSLAISLREYALGMLQFSNTEATKP